MIFFGKHFSHPTYLALILVCDLPLFLPTNGTIWYMHSNVYKLKPKYLFKIWILFKQYTWTNLFICLSPSRSITWIKLPEFFSTSFSIIRIISFRFTLLVTLVADKKFGFPMSSILIRSLIRCLRNLVNALISSAILFCSSKFFSRSLRSMMTVSLFLLAST